MIDLLFRLHLTSLDFSLGLRVPLEAVCYPEYAAASWAAFISSPTLKPPHGPAAAVIFFATRISGTRVWLNFTVPAVHITQWLPLMCLSNLTSTQNSEMHDSMTPLLYNQASSQRQNVFSPPSLRHDDSLARLCPLRIVTFLFLH